MTRKKIISFMGVCLLYSIVLISSFIIALTWDSIQSTVFGETATTLLRSGITGRDNPPVVTPFSGVTETYFGTPFNASKYNEVRFFVKIMNTTGTSFDEQTRAVLRPIMWNNAADKHLDCPEGQSTIIKDCPSGWNFDLRLFSVKNNSSFTWFAHRAESVQMFVDSVNGDDTGRMSIYAQGISN